MADLDDDPMLEDDGTRDVIRKAVAEQMAALPDDDDVFAGAPEPAEVRETVGIEEGADMAAAARTPRRKAAKPEPEPEPGPDPKIEAASEEPAAEAAPDDADPLAALPEDKREAVAARLRAADAVTGLFRGREEQWRGLGQSPQEAARSLLDLHAYAREKPADYLAWAAAQIRPDAPDALLGEAADRLGMKLVPKDDDPFEDEAIRAIREENRRLKAAQAVSGPDTPERRAQAELMAFRAEMNPDGSPRRPLLDRLGPQISARAQAHVAATGRPVTLADIARIYDEEVAALREVFGAPPPSPAAQAATAVAAREQQQAAVQRAKAASKIIDGAGQGASRQPALDENASLRDVIRAQLRRSAD